MYAVWDVPLRILRPIALLHSVAIHSKLHTNWYNNSSRKRLVCLQSVVVGWRSDVAVPEHGGGVTQSRDRVPDLKVPTAPTPQILPPLCLDM